MKPSFKKFIAEAPASGKKAKLGPAKYYGVSKGRDTGLYTITSLDDNMKPTKVDSDLAVDAAKTIVQQYEQQGLKRIGSSDIESAKAPQQEQPKPAEATASAPETTQQAGEQPQGEAKPASHEQVPGVGKIDPAILDDIKALAQMTPEQALASMFKWIKYGAIDLNAYTHLMKGLLKTR